MAIRQQVLPSFALALMMPLLAAAQTTPAAQQQSPTTPPAQTEPSQTQPEFLETVTVSATLNPSTVKETPGTVSVIDASTIQRRLVENIADLVKYEPGVYVETNVTRVGVNGFNIRGIGGNRVMTQIDGVDTSEQFDFGPFNVHQFTLDLDTLKSAEIMRSAGSALYGSDALGGVVSFFTKDPADYLTGRQFHLAGKANYDGRSRDAGGSVVGAAGTQRVQGSLFVSYANGHEPGNQGTVRTEDSRRTALNPQDRRGVQALGKVVVTPGNGASNLLKLTVEAGDNRIDTEAYSTRSAAATDMDSLDTMKRRRFSADQSLVNAFGLTQLSWSLYAQQSDTRQVVDEVRPAAGTTPAIFRSGTLDYSQDSVGGTVQGRKAYLPAGQSLLFTFGGSLKHHVFDMLRDRLDINQQTGAVVPAFGLILPTKYFPKSSVNESGAFLQGELRYHRLLLIPGLRYDRFSLDADASDQVFLDSLSPAPADFAADRVSSKLAASVGITGQITLHGQYAGGFRAPPYSAVNSGFTNLLGGYTSLPNTNLRPESSHNFEAGVRSTVGVVSFGVTGFSNHYADFIQQVLNGTNPATGLLEYQYQNVSKVTIRGLEVQAEARPTSALRLRVTYAAIEGNNVSGATDVPLDTIAPRQGVVGIAYSPAASRWGSELTLRAVGRQSQETAGTGYYAPAGYGVVDATGWFSLSRDLMVRGGVLNLTDAKYFEWTNVRGRLATDPVLDRYSSPGVSGVMSIAYGW